MNNFRFYRTRNETGTRGHTYTVMDAGVRGQVRVQIDDNGKRVGRPRPWQARIRAKDGTYTDEWRRGFKTRDEAAAYIVRNPVPDGKPRENRTPEPAPRFPEPAPQPPFEAIKWCPECRTRYVFKSADMVMLNKTCAKDGATLVDKEPEAPTELKGLPTLPDLRHEQLPFVVSALQAGRHVYLAGPPGTGKSELARQAAESIDMPFHMIACDSSMTRSTLMGFIDAGGAYHRTGLREAVEFGGVFLLDEIDNGNPSLLASLNSAMANGHVAFPDATLPVHESFRVVATANTWGSGPTAEFVGRLRVDPATLDRFVRILVGIDARLERMLAVEAAGGDQVIAKAALTAVRNIRVAAQRQDLRIIISPRAVMQVASLMQRGWAVKDAIMTTSVGTLDPRAASDLIERS